MNKTYEFSLGELVYTIRKLNKLTQVEYSKRLGVVQSTISKVEKDIFDDVPFSLVSKISLDFKVPLQYFQTGTLPLRKSNHMLGIIPPAYLEDGILQAKTIFYILHCYSERYGDSLYKKLNLPHQYLSLSNLRYGPGLLEKLNKIDSECLFNSVSKLNNQFGNIKLKSMKMNLFQYFQSLLDLKFIQQEPNRIVLDLKNYRPETLEILASCLKLELLINLNPEEEFDLQINPENQSITIQAL